MSLFRCLPSIVSSTRCYLRSPVVTSFPRYISSSLNLPPDIHYEELTQKLEAKEITLIDVRPPDEINAVGMIPGSKNIVVQFIGPDILLPEKEFEEKLGFPKPGLNDPLVITCLKGLRARTAQLAMITAGYTNARVYVGSFEDWIEKNGPVVFPEGKPES